MIGPLTTQRAGFRKPTRDNSNDDLKKRRKEPAPGVQAKMCLRKPAGQRLWPFSHCHLAILSGGNRGNKCPTLSLLSRTIPGHSFPLAKCKQKPEAKELQIMQLLWACCQELTNKVEKDESGAGGANNINMHLQSQETIWMLFSQLFPCCKRIPKADVLKQASRFQKKNLSKLKFQVKKTLKEKNRARKQFCFYSQRTFQIHIKDNLKLTGFGHFITFD